MDVLRLRTLEPACCGRYTNDDMEIGITSGSQNALFFEGAVPQPLHDNPRVGEEYM